MEAVLSQKRLTLHTAPSYSRDEGGCEEANGEPMETQLADILDLAHDDSHLWDLKHAPDSTSATHYDEVKACRKNYATARRGRWAIFKDRHEQRLEAPERITYLLVVHEETDARYRRVSPEAMDRIIQDAGLTWHETNMTAGKKVKLGWRHLIDWDA